MGSEADFNTSYVVIKLLEVMEKQVAIAHFNTSYVVIKRVQKSVADRNVFLSIHHMLLLSLLFSIIFRNFIKFQYIICCY